MQRGDPCGRAAPYDCIEPVEDEEFLLAETARCRRLVLIPRGSWEFSARVSFFQSGVSLCVDLIHFALDKSGSGDRRFMSRASRVLSLESSVQERDDHCADEREDDGGERYLGGA